MALTANVEKKSLYWARIFELRVVLAMFMRSMRNSSGLDLKRNKIKDKKNGLGGLHFFIYVFIALCMAKQAAIFYFE